MKLGEFASAIKALQDLYGNDIEVVIVGHFGEWLVPTGTFDGRGDQRFVWIYVHDRKEETKAVLGRKDL